MQVDPHIAAARAAPDIDTGENRPISDASHRAKPTEEFEVEQTSANQTETYYDKFTTTRKWFIVFTCFALTFTSTFSSTALFPAVPEISEDFNTTGEIINVANAGYLIASSVSPLIWTPINMILGRRYAYLAAIAVFAAASAGTAASPNLACFVIMRILSSLENSYFLIAGTGVLADIFEDTQRGTAIGVFLAGSVLGPAIGPVIGAAIVTKLSWRIIFWLQTGMVVACFVPAFILFPQLKKGVKVTSKEQYLEICDPRRIFRIMRFPNITLIYIACGAMAFTFYSLITPIRYVLNPRFNFTSPLESGLFYLAPGIGLVIGSTIGGKWADITVKKYKEKNEYVFEERLRAGLIPTAVLLPLGMLMYGWSVEKKVGGKVVPIIGMFLSGMAQMAGFSALNTYISECLPAYSTETVAGKYLVQYLWSTAGSALALPFLNQIGIGWSTTICAVLVLIGAALIWYTAENGTKIRESQSRKLAERERQQTQT